MVDVSGDRHITGPGGLSGSVTVDHQQAAQPILIVDRAAQVVLDCNVAVTVALQMDRTDVLGLPLGRLLSPANADALPDLRGFSPDPSYVVAHRADGSKLHLMLAVVQGHRDGRLVDIVTLIDVTEHARHASRLSQERSFLERVVQAMPSAVFVKDLQNEGRYVLCTARSGEMVDLAVADILGCTDAELFPPAIAEAFTASDRDVLAAGKMLVSESTVCRPDGGFTVIETKKMAVAEGGGQPRYILGLSEDVTARRELELRLANLAMRDSLTGLANRMMFRERLRLALAARQQVGGYVVLHSLDLDHFKGVNDTLGHAAGDALLVEVARRIEAACDSRHTPARLGGDEFAIIQGPIDSLEEAADLASRVSRSLNHPVAIDGKPLVIGSSAGLAVAPEHGDDPDALLRSADMALYGSKEQGRGTYRFFDQDLAVKLQVRHRMEEDLREALANNQFELHYQPIVAIGANCVVGYEALLRWQHPHRGAVSPSAIIPLAEQTGLIVPLGEWILRQACCEAATWADHRVSVNLSSVQFRSPGLAAAVEAALFSSGLAPERLELEITESVLLSHNRANLDTLHRLRSLGVRIALDDFGTGYSSLGYLSAFPFHKIKIDQALVRDIGSTANGLAVVRSIISLADDLGMSTTAEGVETSEQLDTLRREGCHEAQGFLFDRPLAATAILSAHASEQIKEAKAA